MQTSQIIKTELETVFNAKQASVLAKVITNAYSELVKTSDFNELKDIVKELAKSQQELAEAQKETNRQLQETQKEISKLSKAINDTRSDLTKAIDNTRTELGGLSRSVGYSLENEAYMALPAYLKDKYGIEVTQKFIRTELNGEEINLFAIGKKDNIKVLIVGEVELKLSSVQKFKQLDKKVKAVKEKYKKENIVKILLTHYASPTIIEKAKEKDIIIIQSFEWQ